MAELIETKKEQETAILVGLIFKDQTEEQLDEYMDELAFLAETAGAKVIKYFKQKLPHPKKATFVGIGKLEEIALYVEEKEVDLVIFDDDLSPTQQQNLEEELKVKVVDRSLLILDIFASRAQTAQARTQVEVAQLKYLLPRLKGMWTHLERQRGGIAMRGPGEKEIETDRRIVKDTISRLKKKLEVIDRQNRTQRKTRGEYIRVAMVGYTNVGKSTLMRVLSKSEVFVEDKLFATLDTTVRKIVLGRTPLLLSDTVGFIRKLPHHLVESFKSTLDEVREADILLHVVDIAHPQFEDHIKVVNKTLKDLDIGEKQTITIFNKMDLYRERHFDQYLPEEVKQEILRDLEDNWKEKTENKCLFIAATKKEGIAQLRERLLAEVQAMYKIRYPYRTKLY